MNISLNSFSNYTVSFLQERVLPTLTAQQQKILVIASIALAFIAAAALYVMSCYCKANGLGKQNEEDDHVKKFEIDIEDESEDNQDKKLETDLIDDATNDDSDFKILPPKILGKIITDVNDPLLTRQVCKRWNKLTQAHVIAPLVKEIEKYTGMEKAKAVYEEELDPDQMLSDEKKLQLLFQKQHRRIKELVEALGGTLSHSYKKELETLSLAQYIKNEQDIEYHSQSLQKRHQW